MSPAQPGPRPVGLPAGLEWPVRRDFEGTSGPTPEQARGSMWRRTSRGLYVPATTRLTVEQRIVEAAALLPAYGAVTGWAGLRWLGGRWFEGNYSTGPRPVTLALMDSTIRARPGIEISEERLDPTEIQAHAGLRTTIAAYALLFEIRHARTDREAVIAADMAAYSDLVSRAELIAFVSRCAGWTGISRGRRVCDLMDENAWSPAEVAMRGTWTDDAGCPRPLCNQPIFDLRGNHIGTPDLLDPVLGVAGEYNSELHLDQAVRRRDAERDLAFRAVGLETVAMVTGELGDPWRFVQRLHEAYERAGSRPLSDRRWTIDPPPWWTPTFTVEQRRALSADERYIWLKHRLEAS